MHTKSPRLRARLASALALLLLVFAWAPQSFAVLCALDEVPAATLLVPYFEVDLNNCGSRDTVVTIVNTVPETTIAHITLWTDWGVPSIDFDIYLTGYDRLDFSLAQAFCNGSIPVTGPTVSNHGDFSEEPGAPSFCDLVFPFPDPAIVGSTLDRLIDFHTGQLHAQSGLCHGSDTGDNVARGWITIDVVSDCSLLFPSDPSYFEGTAAYDNVLMGEVLYTDTASGEAALLPAIHLESAPEGEAPTHTFYGSIADAGGSDRREPLPTTYAVRVLPGETSDLIVWREGFTDHGFNAGATCGSSPAAFPLDENPLFAFDDEENPSTPGLSAPVTTQQNPLVLLSSGWLQFDGRHDGAQALYGDDLAQAWVGKVIRPGSGQRLVGPAFAMDSTCDP